MESKRRLSKEAFFVDTNVVIDFKDPFGRTSIDRTIERRHGEISSIVGYLKSSGIKSLSTVSVILEYYKNIQVGFYKVRTGNEQFQIRDFKRLRDKDIDFMNAWDLQMKMLKRTFTRNFPVYDGSPNPGETVLNFAGGSLDFGDHLLYETVTVSPRNLWCIFSNDSDFYSLPDEIFLLTNNEEIIKSAEKNGKLY
ncbi:MAG TPA: hypothetical protein VIS48_16460 [Candidatus Kryptonia bacterium]